MKTVLESSELREDAQLVIAVLREKEDVQLDFSADSVSWLGEYIEQHRHELNAGDKSVLQEKFGAYLGESIRHTYGGRWVRAEGGDWMIVFDEAHEAAPFAIIGEHLDHHTALTDVFAHLPDMLHTRQN